MNKTIDLHTHSIVSDGACTPSEVVKSAHKKGLKAIALTDHDSFIGIDEAIKTAETYDIKIIPGIELSCNYGNDRILHIIALGMDLNNKSFLNAYYKVKEARDKSIPNILEILNSKGVDIDLERLKENALDKYLSRYDVYRYMLENNICASAEEAWKQHLDPIPFTKGELFDIEEALSVIKNAGGLTFLAHYNKNIGFKSISEEEIEEHIQYLISKGLSGIERYYPGFTDEDYNFLDYLINKYNLKVSGGTDFHGENRADVSIGTGYGDLSIPFSIITDNNLV